MNYSSISNSNTSQPNQAAGSGMLSQKPSIEGTLKNGQAAYPHLVDFHGKTLTKPSFSSIYLGQYWQSKKGLAERKYNDRFAKDIVKSKYTDIWKEYRSGSGTFIGSTVDSSTKSPKQINETDIRSIVTKQITSGKVAKPDGQTVYTVYLPPNTTLVAPGGYTSREGLGGYHGSFDLPGGKRVYYAAIAYSQGSNGIDFTGDPKQNGTIVASHEWSEAVTDPDVNNGKLGWYDRTYGEIGDIPINMGMPLEDVYGYVDGYAVQKEWSNKDNIAEVVPGSADGSRRRPLSQTPTATPENLG